MASARERNQRQLLWSEFSQQQVEMLRALRGELSSRRWEIMLDIDDAKALVRDLKAMATGQEAQSVIQLLFEKLNAVHTHLARIPEDIIPPF